VEFGVARVGKPNPTQSTMTWTRPATTTRPNLAGSPTTPKPGLITTGSVDTHEPEDQPQDADDRWPEPATSSAPTPTTKIPTRSTPIPFPWSRRKHWRRPAIPMPTRRTVIWTIRTRKPATPRMSRRSRVPPGGVPHADDAEDAFAETVDPEEAHEDLVAAEAGYPESAHPEDAELEDAYPDVAVPHTAGDLRVRGPPRGPLRGAIAAAAAAGTEIRAPRSPRRR